MTYIVSSGALNSTPTKQPAERDGFLGHIETVLSSHHKPFIGFWQPRKAGLNVINRDLTYSLGGTVTDSLTALVICAHDNAAFCRITSCLDYYCGKWQINYIRHFITCLWIKF